MQSELINFDKIKQIFSYSTGERTIEVTEEEYEKIYDEVTGKGLKVNKNAESFAVEMDDLTIKIVKDVDEDE